MSNRSVRFEFTPEENQQIEATIILPKEPRSVIHGIVKNHRDCIVKDAVVKLFEVIEHCGKCELKPIGHTFTDEFGQFLFGPLCPDRCYLIKVWVNDIKIKEVVIKPDPEDPCDDREDDCDCEPEPRPDCRQVERGFRRRENGGRYANRFRDRDFSDDDDDEDDE